MTELLDAQPLGDLPQEIRYVRARIHKLFDDSQVMAGLMTECRLKIAGLESDVTNLRNETATRQQLTSAIELLSVKIQGLSDDLEPVKKGITWAVSLTMGAVMLALLSLVLHKGIP